MPNQRNVLWVVVWVGLGLALGLWVLATRGIDAAAEYYAAYCLEKSLSVDNIFVFVIIFSELHIPAEHQRRVLQFGIAGALVFRALLIGAFAAVALVLAVVGVFGVMAYAVSQRTPEIGVRIALGATAGQILRLLFGRAIGMIGLGLAVGFVGAALTTRFLGSLLFAVTPTDPVTYVIVAVLLATTSFVALYLPASRATRVDPLVALRQE